MTQWGNRPANAGDIGSLNPWSGKIPHATEQLGLRATTIQLVLWSPETPATEAHAPESLGFATREAVTMRSPRITTRESPQSNKDPAQPKISN